MSALLAIGDARGFVVFGTYGEFDSARVVLI